MSDGKIVKLDPATPALLWNIGMMLKRRKSADQSGPVVEILFPTEGEAGAFMQLLEKIEEKKDR